MLFTVRSFSNTPYLYDSNTNEFYKLDEEFYKDIEAAECKVKNINNEKILQTFKELGIHDNPLPVQDPSEFKKDVEDSNIGFQKLIIGLTHICNLRCRYCIYSGNYKDERTHEGKSMTIETADKIFETFFTKNKYPKLVSFYGGEPFMNFSVISHIVEKITNAGYKPTFSVTTNSLMLENEKILDFVIKHNFYVNISFDGPIQEKMRIDEHGNGTYNRVMNVIAKISKNYPDFYKNNVGFNVTVTYATNIPQTAEFFNTNPLFSGKMLNIIRHYDPDNTFCRKYDLIENEMIVKNEFDSLRRHYPEVYKNKLPFNDGCYLSVLARINQRSMGDSGKLPLNSCCYPGMNAAFVDIDGTCSACERTEHAPIGNIYETPVDQKRADNYIKKYFEMAGKVCPSCWASKLCAKCFSHVRRGELTEKNFLEFCDDFRESLKKSIELFLSIKEIDEKAFDDIKAVTVD